VFSVYIYLLEQGWLFFICAYGEVSRTYLCFSTKT